MPTVSARETHEAVRPGVVPGSGGGVGLIARRDFAVGERILARDGWDGWSGMRGTAGSSSQPRCAGGSSAPVTCAVSSPPLASRRISATSQAEKPYCVVPGRAASAEAAEAAAKAALVACTPEDRTLFFTLSDKYVSSYVPSSASHDETLPGVTVTGIVETNGLPMGDALASSEYAVPPSAGLYALCCRANHSCQPNAHHQYNGAIERETLHALRPVAVPACVSPLVPHLQHDPAHAATVVASLSLTPSRLSRVCPPGRSERATKFSSPTSTRTGTTPPP